MGARMHDSMTWADEPFTGERAGMNSVPSAVWRSPAVAGRAYAALPPWNFPSGFLACIPQHLLVLRVADSAWSK